MTAGIDLSKALDALTAELAALRTVADHLAREHQALVDLNADELEQAIISKNQALDALAAKRAARESFTGDGSLEAWIASWPENDTQTQAAKQLIEQMHALGTECQQQNQRNGRLIGGLKESTEGALGVLRAGEASVTLYGQDGDRSSDLGSRSLGTA